MKRKADGAILRKVQEVSPRSPTTSAVDDEDIIQQIKTGFPVAHFQRLGKALDLTEDQLAGHLGISRATLHRRKQSGRLDSFESDRLHRFARLFQLAAEVFDGREEGRQWLSTSQYGLGGAVPLDYAETEAGAHEVENLLGRIEYGVYS